MKDTIQMDQAGRVVLPKQLRERFRLRAGDSLAIEAKGDTIELRPTRAGTRLQRIEGVLVLAGESDLPERDLVQDLRNERLEEIEKETVSKR
jgi:AbrB family looped-hinge helix DNA binding protein